MPEILSQSQIDELLSELSTGGIQDEQIDDGKTVKKVKEYDFRSPKKLSKEQKKSLLGVYENFARYLSSYLSGVLRTSCDISIDSIEEQPYFEYNNALPDIIMIGVMEIKPIEGVILLDISNAITFAIIERLLGGNAKEVYIPDREFSEIEIVLIEGVLKKITDFLKDAWSHVKNVEVTMKQIETNSRLIQTMPMEEIVVIIMMNVDINGTKGTMNFCIPCLNLESVLEQLNQDQYAGARKIDESQMAANKNTILSRIKDSPIKVCGVFDSTTLTLGEVMNLQVGDVIKLDQRIDSEMKVTVDDELWFYGIPGTKHKKKVIKIDKVLKRKEQE